MAQGIRFRGGSGFVRTTGALVAVLCGLAATPPPPGHHRASPEFPLELKIEGSRRLRLDLATTADQQRLRITLTQALFKAETDRNQWLAWRRNLPSGTSPSRTTTSRLLARHHQPTDQLGSTEIRALKELQRLLERWLIPASLPEKNRVFKDMVEISKALENHRRPPAPGFLEFAQLPFVLWDYHHNPVAQGRSPAVNIDAASVDSSSDLSLVQPTASSFWTRPAAVHTANLFAGFGRAQKPAYENELWTYHAPKTSYGGNAGFEAQSGARRLKVKFAETTSEPFTSRIFSALGYHVDATDYVPYLRVQYDRRWFCEFNVRKDVKTRIRLLGFLPIYTIRLQRHFDPFDYLAAAVMQDGRRLGPEELKRALLRNPGKWNGKFQPHNFNPETEQAIAYLVTIPANVQERPRETGNLGPWDFGQLDHAGLREVRGVGLLGAWLGWFDSRFENTRLRAVTENGGTVLRHYFTDLGGGLGDSVGPTSRRAETPNEFGWYFTRVRAGFRAGESGSLQIVNYQPIEDTEAFRQLTIADARWMARWIAQISEDQLVQALVASGFDSAQVRIYTEKLIARRDRMMADLGLANEIPFLRPSGANQRLSYDPRCDGPVNITVGNSVSLSAPSGPWRIEAGRVARRP